MSGAGAGRGAGRPPGITVRSRAGRVGTHMWSRRWLGDLEETAGRRVTFEGRAAARAGRVLTLDHDGAVVRCAVGGSQPDPFEVSFRFRPLPAGDHAALRAEVDAPGDPDTADEGLLGALAGRFADGVGFRLLPAVDGDTTWTCTCGPTSPCAHVIASAAVMVEWWDREPGVLFVLRGVGPAELGPNDGGLPGADPAGALTDPWGPVGRLPVVPSPAPSDVLDLLDGPVARRLASAATHDPMEQLRILSDLEDLYHALLDGD